VVKVQARNPVTVAPTDATSIWTSQALSFARCGLPAISHLSRNRDALLSPEHLHLRHPPASGGRA
jgi:hypothetical protein